MRQLVLVGLLLLAGCRSAPDPVADRGGDGTRPAGWVDSRLIFDNPPFASCHASTIVDTPHGLIAAWFAGPYEKHPDVTIWTARHDGRRWLPPEEVANGIQADGKTRYPCWNPVLFQLPKGPLLLFYKVGPSPSTWWGMLIRSEDGGRSWSSPVRLPEGILGPIRCKPILLPDGGLLCGSSSEDQGWRLHMERTADGGQTWDRTGALNDGREAALIQPTLLRWPSGRIQALCRSRQGWIYETWMGGTWKDWSSPRPMELPNPNSGVDAVMLKDGRALMVYNHTPKGRSPLNVAVAREGGPWERVVSLEEEPGEYSYPAVAQARDGKVHITYTWKRERIKHVVLDPARLRPVSPLASPGR